MKTFVKHYIGKGKSVNGLQIAKCTCRLDELTHFAYEFDGTYFVTFEVAKMKSVDNFGRDFTVYVNQKEETGDPKTEKKGNPSKSKSARKLKRPAEFAEQDIPF